MNFKQTALTFILGFTTATVFAQGMLSMTLKPFNICLNADDFVVCGKEVERGYIE